MSYIVLDLEWNQPVSPSLLRTKPVRLSGEIIQIGAVRLNNNFETDGTFRIFIKPYFYKKLHWSVSKLTKITYDDLNDGMDFRTALKTFYDWCGENPVFITWGPDDIPMMRNNMLMYDMDTSVISNVYDVQKIFDSQITNLGRQYGLSDAMTIVGEEELTAHDALNDSLNTVAIIRHLDMKRGMEEYQESFNVDNLRVLLSDSITYENYNTLKRSQSHREFSCTVCGKTVRSADWINSGKNRKISLAHCECGEDFFLRFIVKKHADESMSVLRSVYALDDEIQRYYDEKEKKYQEKMEKYRRRFSHTEQ